MLPAITMETEASHMLEAALEQMDDIIAGSKAAAVEFSNSMYDLGSPISAGPLQVVQLAEDLKLALELQPNQEERDNLRAQLQAETAQALIEWLQSGTRQRWAGSMETPIDFYRHFSWLKKVNLCSPANNETYQERLLRLEGDKESLVSVLTDQVEAQGEKIRDLESSLEEHRQKLASTEEMLQQELISRTSLETQKLDLMDEVSYLKLKLCVVNLISELQEQMCKFQAEISTRIQEKRALEEKEAQQGEPRGGQARAQGHGPQLELPGSGLSLSGSDAQWMHNGGQTVHDLLQEVKQLKSKVEELEGEKSQYERKLRATKAFIVKVFWKSLWTHLLVHASCLKTGDCPVTWKTDSVYRLSLPLVFSPQAEISELQQLLASKDAEIECLQTQLLARDGSGNDNAERDQEYQRLKVGMESLLASNDEKYRKMREVMALTQGSSEEELTGSLKLRAITHKAHSDILRSEAVEIQPAESESDVGAENPDMQLNKYQTLPGKLSQKSEMRVELNGDGEYLSPVQLSPVHSNEQPYRLSEFLHH
ncbi:hypothetical protein INR49_005109 [Caranx melampygus]|nr:hypothetical protein INR49_005109 [Caranx melampygus]